MPLPGKVNYQGYTSPTSYAQELQTAKDLYQEERLKLTNVIAQFDGIDVTDAYALLLSSAKSVLDESEKEMNDKMFTPSKEDYDDVTEALQRVKRSLLKPGDARETNKFNKYLDGVSIRLHPKMHAALACFALALVAVGLYLLCTPATIAIGGILVLAGLITMFAAEKMRTWQAENKVKRVKLTCSSLEDTAPKTYEACRLFQQKLNEHPKTELRAEFTYKVC
jgi:hypothetical protein